MSEDAADFQSRVQKQQAARRAAAATKKRNTRDKLITAVDELRDASDAELTVEAITTTAGVSTATFYTYYRSRNHLCLDAASVLIAEAAEQQIGARTSIDDRVSIIQGLCEGREVLIRAALVGRLEPKNMERWGISAGKGAGEPVMTIRISNQGEADFVERVAVLLWKPCDPGIFWNEAAIRLHMVALNLLEFAAFPAIRTNFGTPLMHNDDMRHRRIVSLLNALLYDIKPKPAATSRKFRLR